MSYSVWGIQSIAVNLNGKYYELLKKDITRYKENPDFINTLSKPQNNLFLGVLDCDEENDNERDYFSAQADFDNGYQEYDGGRNSENYADIRPVDLDSGMFLDCGSFNGWVYEFSCGASSLYVPEFKNKEAVIKAVK